MEKETTRLEREGCLLREIRGGGGAPRLSLHGARGGAFRLPQLGLLPDFGPLAPFERPEACTEAVARFPG